jgi:hypothetical protein
MLLLPAVLAALSLSVAPALAGEDDDSGSAALHASSHGCVAGKRAKAAVSGNNIASVAFYVDGKRVKTVTRPAATGRFVFSMRCARLSVGAHRARAVVTFTPGTSPARRTLRYQITRLQQSSPRFTG